jgi:Wiskott-Aldrich syndrome protein
MAFKLAPPAPPLFLTFPVPLATPLAAAPPAGPVKLAPTPPPPPLAPTWTAVPPMEAQFEVLLQRYESPPVPPVPPAAAPPPPPAPTAIVTEVLSGSVTFTDLEYAPPPPPTPGLIELPSLPPAPPPPPPIASIVLLELFQSDGTLQLVPDVRYTMHFVV